MKKRILIPTIIGLILVITIGIIMYNNRTISTIILDINPSIKISLNKKGKIKNIVPINSDAKDIIDNNLRGKTLNEALENITEKVIDKGYTKENKLVVLVYSTGKVTNSDVEHELAVNFKNKNIGVEIIPIKNITKEDRALAKKYDISLSKASYINSIKEENEIPENKLVDKAVNELKETKETGKYCDEGYTLEGDFCVKEIKREPAKRGEVCETGYYEYEGKCYEEASPEIGELVCGPEFELKEDKCYKKDIMDAEPSYKCEKGSLPSEGEYLKRGVDRNICVDKTNAVAPTLRCMIGPHIVVGGKCYVGPAPTINGGCPNNDMLVSGGCYSLDPEDQWQCPDGEIYMKSKGQNIELCPDTYTYTKPTITSYTCLPDYKLEGDKCIKEEVVDAYHETSCKEPYTLAGEGRCINFKNTKPKQDGYVCENNARLEDNMCITYEVIDAKN